MYTKMDGTSWCLIKEDQEAHQGKVAIIYPNGSLWMFGTRSYNKQDEIDMLGEFIKNGYPKPMYEVSFVTTDLNVSDVYSNHPDLQIEYARQFYKQILHKDVTIRSIDIKEIK